MFSVLGLVPQKQNVRQGSKCIGFVRRVFFRNTDRGKNEAEQESGRELSKDLVLKSIFGLIHRVTDSSGASTSPQSYPH